MKIRYFSSHKIRFYVASKLYSENVPEGMIQGLMGHKYVTTRHYCSRDIGNKTIDMEVIDKVLGRNELPTIAQ